jgi:pimeloyl-ACP methyl ester carboxylesterase
MKYSMIHVFGLEHEPRIVFFPGWLSTTKTWRYFLRELSNRFRVEYFESREKPSAEPDVIPCQTFESQQEDMVAYLNSMPDKPYAVIASSMGALVYLSIIDRLHRKPTSQVIVAPIFRSPKPEKNWLLIILYRLFKHAPGWAFYFLQSWLLGCIKLVSKKNNSHQFKSLLTATTEANFPRAAASVRHLPEFKFEPAALARIDVPTLVVAAKSDSVHSPNDAECMNNSLPNSRLVFYKTFAHTHSSACAKATAEWILRQK